MATYLDGMEGGKHNSDNCEARQRSKIKKVCKRCGGENVRKDAWASWNEEFQEWKLAEVYDNEYCNDCEGETTIVDEL